MYCTYISKRPHVLSRHLYTHVFAQILIKMYINAKIRHFFGLFFRDTFKYLCEISSFDNLLQESCVYM